MYFMYMTTQSQLTGHAAMARMTTASAPIAAPIGTTTALAIRAVTNTLTAQTDPIRDFSFFIALPFKESCR
jgi:hypothetical protein